MAPRDLAQLETIRGLLEQNRDGPARGAVHAVMAFLAANRADYHWTGVYVLDGDSLVLGPYVGPETDHTRIPVGRGVCGTAVAENANQIVDDVRAVANYLACNLATRSEIVVLIRQPQSGAILGQIDVDGTRVKQFGAEEAAFLSAVAELLAPLTSTAICRS